MAIFIQKLLLIEYHFIQYGLFTETTETTDPFQLRNNQENVLNNQEWLALIDLYDFFIFLIGECVAGFF